MTEISDEICEIKPGRVAIRVNILDVRGIYYGLDGRGLVGLREGGAFDATIAIVARIFAVSPSAAGEMPSEPRPARIKHGSALP
ncbi:MAG TPA: hypothetical protein VE820_14420 [Sphingomicrobium sp.]|jgi:hypothetical protein|nr:hypothetical protein [Sphingomicrobium sp.]